VLLHGGLAGAMAAVRVGVADDSGVRPHAETSERLEFRGLRDVSSAAQGDSHAALCVDASGRGPVDFVSTDDPTSSADQGVRDAAVLVAVTADGQYGAGVQDEDGHAG